MINNEEFILKEIPKFHPSSQRYLSFWKEEKRKCIEGVWVSGKYMPGKLYFYINYGTIKRNLGQSKVKSYARPLLRDLEWNFFYLWLEARGFSGFTLDEENTSLDIVKEWRELGHDDPSPYIIEFYPEAINPRTGKLKQYVFPREYLRRIHSKNLGRPHFLNNAHNLFMLGPRGYGKDLHKDTKLIYEGYEKRISEVKIGDKIYNHKGMLTTVTNVFKFTDQLQYEITLADGRTIKCGAGHKWKVKERISNGKYLNVVKELKDILLDYKVGKREDTKYFIEICSPIMYEYKSLPVDPYTLGVLIGDGGLTQSIGITTADTEIIENLVIPEDTYIVKDKSKYHYYIRKKGSRNSLTQSLNRLGLMGKKSENKFIPSIYLYGSFEQRIHLLQGLMDTDGSISKKGQIEYSTSSKQLSIDVQKLCQSLGIRCKISERETSHLKSYRLNIITSTPIFRLKRKLSRLNLNPSKYAVTNRSMVAIKNIKPTKIEDSYCISVDGEDNLFLAGDFIPTHNSYTNGGIVTHEYLFDGMTEYKRGYDSSSEVIVGAGESKYSSETLDKVKVMLERLPGALDIGGITFPAPFYKRYTGSWTPGNQITATYKKKVGGQWENVGSKSNIKHRSFKDNPFAASGTRPGIILFEEVGMFDNLIESYMPCVECQREGSKKFGTMMFIGTGGDMAGGGCVCAGSKVWTKNGDLVNIEDLWQSQGIIGFNEETQQASQENITYWQAPTDKPCYRIITNSKRILECSDDHPILYSKISNFRKSFRDENGKRNYQKKVEWIEAKDLKIGDQVAIINDVPFFNTTPLAHARLLGLLIGDGSYTDTPHLYSADKEILDFLIENKYDFTVLKEEPTKDNRVFRSIRIRQLCPVLKQLEILGQTKNNKRLPKDIHSYSKESICDFLGGFFDADGTINKDKIQLASSCYELLNETRFLLQKLGIHCTIIKRNPPKASQENKKIKSLNPWYYIQISDKRSILIFAENIKFLVQAKQNKLKAAVEMVSKKLDYYAKNLIGLRFENITDIEYIGIKPVYNLTADSTHTYVANGIVTHNTLAAQKMFYEPENFDCLVFNDEWEFRGKIGYFIPAYMGLHDFKDANGNTKKEEALQYLEKVREKLRTTKGSSASLEAEIVNRPLVPSEMFLQRAGAIMPIPELRELKARLEGSRLKGLGELPVTLFFNPDSIYNGVDYKIDVKKELLPINSFPWKDSSREGAVVIYELPQLINDRVPEGAYIIGHDPYGSDSQDGESLGAIQVIKTKKYFDKIGHDEVVATYYGRPWQGRHIVNEILYKLSKFYGNAKIYFENVRGNVKEYFEKIKRLDLLAHKPITTLSKRASHEQAPTLEYGYPMSSRDMKLEAAIYVRDWLLEERSTHEGKVIRNLDKLRDMFLIDQLLAFNLEGNFDAVMAFMGCIIGINETYNQYEKNVTTTNNWQVIDKDISVFLANNKKLFKTWHS